MRHLTYVSIVLLALLMSQSASAEIFDKSNPGMDKTQEALFKSSFLTVDVPVPYIKPRLADIKRSRSFTADMLINNFFGGQANVMGKEPIVHPVWGNGTRYKSGMVLRLVESGSQSLSEYQDTEVVPAFLDVYTRGFVYENNIPHAPVARTEMVITSETTSDVKNTEAYSAREGRNLVESLISGMFGSLEVPAGFQSTVYSGIQEDGERLFMYRANPEYIAPVEVPDVNGGNTTMDTGIPLLDVYTHVLMDGERNLVGMEYFWDNTIAAQGGVKDCYSANQALVLAREALYKNYQSHPPLLTITNIKLGYFQSRSNSTMLVPGWLFDAWYSEKSTQLNTRGSSSYNQSQYINVPMPFAINAITGELVEL